MVTLDNFLWLEFDEYIVNRRWVHKELYKIDEETNTHYFRYKINDGLYATVYEPENWEDVCNITWGIKILGTLALKDLGGEFHYIGIDDTNVDIVNIEVYYYSLDSMGEYAQWVLHDSLKKRPSNRTVTMRLPVYLYDYRPLKHMGSMVYKFRTDSDGDIDKDMDFYADYKLANLRNPAVWRYINKTIEKAVEDYFSGDE